MHGCQQLSAQFIEDFIYVDVGHARSQPVSGHSKVAISERYTAGRVSASKPSNKNNSNCRNKTVAGVKDVAIPR
jgi:hypothetical protein